MNPFTLTHRPVLCWIPFTYGTPPSFLVTGSHRWTSTFPLWSYLEKLTTLVEDLRNDLDMPDLPFVAGQVNNVPAINEQIAKLPKSLSATGFVSSDGLKTMDRWHFDNASMKLLGTRYAEEMLKLQAASKK